MNKKILIGMSILTVGMLSGCGSKGAQPGVYQNVYEEEMEGELQTYYNYIVLKEDGTGLMEIQDDIPITWKGTQIVAGDTKYDYEVVDGGILLKESFGDSMYSYLEGIQIDEYLENKDNPEYKFYIEGAANIPNSFVEEAAGVTQFDSYEEVIKNLTTGQGYAYINMQGYDGELLVISNEIYSAGEENLALDGVVYATVDGKVQYVTAAHSDGTARPIAVNNGILTYAEQHCVNGDFFTPDGKAVMVKFFAYENFDEGTGNASYGGFLRETNSFDEANETEVTTEEQYYDLYQIYLDATPIDFTIVE